SLAFAQAMELAPAPKIEHGGVADGEVEFPAQQDDAKAAAPVDDHVQPVIAIDGSSNEDGRRAADDAGRNAAELLEIDGEAQPVGRAIDEVHFHAAMDEAFAPHLQPLAR